MAFPHRKHLMPGPSLKRRKVPRSKTLVRKVRRHRGDITRNAQRLDGAGKGQEHRAGAVASRGIVRQRLHCEYHARDLLGRPDFVFRECQLVVFVDGDFWHGWRFSVWRDKLSAKWEQKIESTRRRDSRVHRSSRRAGWRVLRIWEHQIERDLDACVRRVLTAIR